VDLFITIITDKKARLATECMPLYGEEKLINKTKQQETKEKLPRS
jgi:hypothetical protein